MRIFQCFIVLFIREKIMIMAFPLYYQYQEHDQFRGGGSATKASMVAEDIAAVPTSSNVLLETSSSGVDIAQASQYLDDLYPPALLQGRNALSRTDGYWPFVHDGKDPPVSLTYGEFDFASLASLLEDALTLSGRTSWKNAVFTDIGSGTGRMVMAAAALHDWRLCRGVELLPGLHDTAVEIAITRDDPIVEARARGDATWGSAVELRCGSFEEEYFGDSDLLFSFSTCMNGSTMELMAKAIRKQCQVGTIVITTDYSLGNDERLDSNLPKIQCVQQVSAWCELLGGDCVAYIHRLVE